MSTLMIQEMMIGIMNRPQVVDHVLAVPLVRRPGGVHHDLVGWRADAAPPRGIGARPPVWRGRLAAGGRRQRQDVGAPAHS